MKRIIVIRLTYIAIFIIFVLFFIVTSAKAADLPALAPIPPECFHDLIWARSDRATCSIPPLLVPPEDQALAAHYGAFTGYSLLLQRSDVITVWKNARALDPEWRETWGDLAVYLAEHLFPSPACDCAIDKGNAVYPQRSPFGRICWRKK